MSINQLVEKYNTLGLEILAHFNAAYNYPVVDYRTYPFFITKGGGVQIEMPEADKFIDTTLYPHYVKGGYWLIQSQRTYYLLDLSKEKV